MKNKIINHSLLVILALIAISCNNNDDLIAPNIVCEETIWEKNKEVSEIFSMASSSPAEYTNDDYIEAYVTSNDERGNFFKTVHLQTIPSGTTNPIGIVLSIDKDGLFGMRFTPGKKVTVSLKGLYYAIVDGSLKIGSLYEGEVGRILERDISSHIFASCNTSVSEETLARTLTISSAINNSNLNTLIDIDNVQFGDVSLGRTLYDIDSGGGATNHTIIDRTTGQTAILRTSSFAQFSGTKVPSGTGKIRGVLTKFGSTFQFLVRDLSDFRLETPRFYDYLGTLNENFESYSNNQINLPKYLNLRVEGTKSWITKTSSGLKYIEMSSFGGTPEKNRSLFMVPANFTDASTLQFQIRTQFHNGAALKVYYTTNYTPGDNINNATFYDITSSFSIPTVTIASFVNAGTYSIPSSVNGNGFFVFEYVGSNLTSGTVVTTTIQIDNIVIN